ncbi:MAG: hypothetical protein Q9170_004243 [Blastenia crenularia]
MSLLNFLCFFLSILLPCLALPGSPPSSLTAPSVDNDFPQPFIFTRYPYTINYTHDPFGRPGVPITTPANFRAAVEQATAHLKSMRAQAGSLPYDPIPGNRFEVELELARPSQQHYDNPRKLRFEMEGRFTQVPALALRYVEVGITLLGLLDYVQLRAASTAMCTWEVGDLRSHPDIWIARGGVSLIAPDTSTA